MTFPPSADRVEPGMCPWCGGGTFPRSYFLNGNTNNIRWFVRCAYCPVRGPDAASEQETIEAWNRVVPRVSAGRDASAAKLEIKFMVPDGARFTFAVRSPGSPRGFVVGGGRVDSTGVEWVLSAQDIIDCAAIVASAVEKAKGGGPDAG